MRTLFLDDLIDTLSLSPKSGNTLSVRDCLKVLFVCFFVFDIGQCPWPTRPYEFNNKGIKMVYLSPNMSLIQLLDQRVIINFKAHYTWYSMERIVKVMEENPDGTL